MRGRFAPSPTGALHLGNLRTAAVAWLLARQGGGGFVLRMEDLDPVTARPQHVASQVADLAAIGIDWDGPVVHQSDRSAVYADAIETLGRAGLLYPCYCSRREIREAASAPHAGVAADGAYAGTCRELTVAERRQRERLGRPAALRLRADAQRVVIDDRVAGRYEGVVDDVVVRRNDGVAAYNLAVVVDDAAQGVTEVVRGDDLLASTPRQVLLQRLLDLPTPAYAHLPLTVGADGERLAKRHGAVTLGDLAARSVGVTDVVSWIARSLACRVPTTPWRSVRDLLGEFDLARVPKGPVIADVAPSPA